jgi:hypothetical protein
MNTFDADECVSPFFNGIYGLDLPTISIVSLTFRLTENA